MTLAPFSRRSVITRIEAAYPICAWPCCICAILYSLMSIPTVLIPLDANAAEADVAHSNY